MHVEGELVNVQSGKENPSSVIPVPVKILPVAVFVKISTVFVELFLRVNILQKTSMVPPVFGGLHENGVGFKFFDKFLGALSEHSGLVGSADQVNIFAIEAFSQVDKRGREAALSNINQCWSN